RVPPIDRQTNSHQWSWLVVFVLQPDCAEHNRGSAWQQTHANAHFVLGSRRSRARILFWKSFSSFIFAREKSRRVALRAEPPASRWNLLSLIYARQRAWLIRRKRLWLDGWVKLYKQR